MSRVAQALDLCRFAFKRCSRPLYTLPARLFGSACAGAALVGASSLLAGCGAGGFSLDKAEVDRSIVTSNVPAAAPAGDSTMLSDQATIRNAVSSADVESLAGKAVPWANPDTGSRGSITALSETKQDTRICRTFSASRESFDGVAMFNGEACMISAGAWRIETFTAL